MKHFSKKLILFYALFFTAFWSMSILVVGAQVTSSKTSMSKSKLIKSQPLINTLPLDNSRQAIVVTVSNNSSRNGIIKVYEKNKDKTWKNLWTYTCIVGKSGVSANRHEGDMTTPEGIYGFLFEFGSANNPGTKMKYIKTKQGDYWSSLPTKSEYNTWVHYDGKNPNKRFGFGKYEDLYAISRYKYAAALDFNYNKNKIIGKGSAIFLHIAPYGIKGTEGRIALKESELVKLLKWMDPSKKPKICIGTESYLRKL